VNTLLHVWSSQVFGHIELSGRCAVNNLEGGSVDIGTRGSLGGRFAVCVGRTARQRLVHEAEAKDAVLLASASMAENAGQNLFDRQTHNK
jgi:hypothetical protein